MKTRSLKTRWIAALSAGTMLMQLPAITPAAADSLNYGDALKLSLYFYDSNQCGTEVDDNPLTWRGNCHTYDAAASLNDAVGLTDAEKAVIKAANGGADTVDVSGGYHDAGDHIKSTMTMGFSATSLAWSYYTNPAAFKDTGSRAHLFDILKEMCDYMMKVTYLDDSGAVVAFCYLVSNSGDHSEWLAPEKQTSARPTYWGTASHQSADTAGEMAAALASSSVALREVDADYADECLKYAKALRDFAQKYPGASYDGIGDMYSSSSQVDDIAWADLWCHVADGTISSYTPVSVNSDGSYNASTGTEYDGWIYSWGKVWGGYCTLLYSLGFDAYGSTVLNNMNRLLSNPTAGSYSIVADGWGASRYSCAWQMYSTNYAATSGESRYAENAKTQMDYLLGGNPDNRSYLLGYTDTFPSQIHHRGANPNKGTATYVLYGGLVGGPTDANGSYNDYYDSYACTEPALDYNGCFTLAISGLCTAFGAGDGSGADAVIAAASEIDETTEFGAWYEEGGQVDPPTTTDTTEPVGDAHVGDVNCDGMVKIGDVILLNRFLAEDQTVSISDQGMLNAEADGTNGINGNDATAILKIIAGLE